MCKTRETVSLKRLRIVRSSVDKLVYFKCDVVLHVVSSAVGGESTSEHFVARDWEVVWTSQRTVLHGVQSRRLTAGFSVQGII